MTGEEEIARARADAALARERLLGTALEVQARLRPAQLANEAWDAVREKGEAVAGGAARAVAERPAVASAAAVGLVAVLARKPIARLFSRFRED